MKIDRRTSRILRTVACAFAFLFLLSVIMLVTQLWERRNGEFSGEEVMQPRKEIKYGDDTYILRDDVETILLFGLDQTDEEIRSTMTGYSNDRCADFLLLLAIDHTNHTFSALQINRDTMAEMNMLGITGEKIGTVVKQISLSHTYGSGDRISSRNVMDAVSMLLHNIKINHYVSATMDIVPVSADAVDGVEVLIEDDFSQIEPSFVMGETVTLRGNNALTYVRSRSGMLNDQTNANRMVRQKAYVTALYEKAVQKYREDASFASSAFLDMADYLASDCSVNRLQTIFEQLTGYEFSGIRTIEGEFRVTNYMEFYPDEDSLTRNVLDLFYKKDV